MVNYNETFSPVVRFSTIRVIIAIAIEYELLLHHLDVTSAYLNGELEDTVYMSQPEGFIDKKNPNKVCKFLKSLYGLKQAGREWNKKLDSVLHAIGFRQCSGDNCVYVMNEGANLNIIAIYVDDIMIACSNESSMSQIKQKICDEFECVDKGPIKYFLGIQVERSGSRGSISIHQNQYISSTSSNGKL